MKKIYLLLVIVMSIIGMTACNDNDLPDVTVDVKMSGATRVGNVLYVVQGDDLKIESLTLDNHSGKNGVIGRASYYWDNYLVGENIVSPYGMTLETSGAQLGLHSLQLVVAIYVVDYPASIATLGYEVKIVASPDDIPTNGDVEPEPQVTMHLMHAD